MPLGPGTRLGPYEILSALGSGGMGEVYRARDTRLQRDVAVKVLPAAYSSDPERLARFEQEARAAAALNHPNILAVFDIGTHNNAPYIVSELLEGSTLREQIPGLPVRKAIDDAIQIARGLAAAHDKGIVHRDLKPENIFVTSDARVKILDFGLAKLTQAEPVAAGMSALATTPVFPAHAPQTIAGFVLGTVGYMAPEQVRGVSADHRADIFAFGTILYEMLSGRRAFQGETTMDTMTAILKEAPLDLPSGDRHIPAALTRIVDKCMEKTPAARFQSASDLAFALEGASTASGTEASATIAYRYRLLSNARLAWAVAGVLAFLSLLTLVFAVSTRRSTVAAPGASAIARLTIALPPGDEVSNVEYPALALSSDGTQLVYSGTRAGRLQLYLRKIDQHESQPIAGTDGATMPFFSPDGQWVGFFAQGKLKKVSVAAGVAQVLCDANGLGGKGGSWGADNMIYFAPTNFSGIFKVSASGGTPEPVTQLDRSRGEITHRWPQVLPGGKALLFTVWTAPGRDGKDTYVQSLESGERHLLARGADTGRYVSTGHLVYGRGDALFAVAMGLDRLQVTGAAPIRLAEAVRSGGEGADYAVADTGQLVFVAGSAGRYQRRLVWVDRKGTVEPTPLPPEEYQNVALSPDGLQAIVEISGDTWGFWIYDPARGTLTPLTTGAGGSQIPVWTPDGKRVAYRATRAGFRNLFWKAVDDATPEERLTTKESVSQIPGSFSADQQWLAYSDGAVETGGDIYVLRLDANRKPQPFLATLAEEGSPRFSPDGHWIAYMSNESGRFEVYVQPFPGPGGKRLMSTAGGTQPTWSRNGRELFYLNGDRMMVVDVSTAPVFSASAPRVLYEGRYFPSATSSGYDLSPDGQRFLRIQPTEDDPPTNQIQIVMNWFNELRQPPATQ